MDFSILGNCSGSTASFTNLSQLVGSSQSDLKFFWRFNDPAASVINPDTSLLVNPTHIFINGGLYNIQLQVTSPLGCVANLVKPVTIIGIPQMKLVFRNNDCSNAIQAFVDSTTVPFSSLLNRTIFWDWENNPAMAVIDNTPVLGKLYQQQYPSFSGNATKRFVVKNMASSLNGCTSERYDTILLKLAPQLVFDTIASVCISADLVSINAARETSGINGSGAYSGQSISSFGIFNPIMAGIGTHRLNYFFTALNGCSDTAFGSIVVYPLPIVNAGADKTIIAGGSILLEGVFSANTNSILWSPSQFLSSAVVPRPLASPVVETMFTVTAISNNNCTATDSVLVKVLPALKIPNVFSPNKDGINDVWNIPYLSSYIGCTMDIFDRYGRIIYSSVGYNQPWDATFKGDALPVGVYYYRLDIKNGKKPVSGSVTVIR